MTSNYLLFSEVIKPIPLEAIEWIQEVLEYDVEARGAAKLGHLLCVEEEAVSELELDGWPSFCWQLDTNECSLSLYSEESAYLEHVEYFIKALIIRFMPDYRFALSAAETCDQRRQGEFGGIWLYVDKSKTIVGNTAEPLNILQKGRLSADDVLQRIVNTLWPTEDHSWSPDTIDEIAQILIANGYKPTK